MRPQPPHQKPLCQEGLCILQCASPAPPDTPSRLQILQSLRCPHSSCFIRIWQRGFCPRMNFLSTHRNSPPQNHQILGGFESEVSKSENLFAHTVSSEKFRHFSFDVPQNGATSIFIVIAPWDRKFFGSSACDFNFS